jgi:hypothetical protein
LGAAVEAMKHFWVKYMPEHWTLGQHLSRFHQAREDLAEMKRNRSVSVI